MADLPSSWPTCSAISDPRHGRPRPAISDRRHGRLDRPSPAGRGADSSLSRWKRGRPGRWTSQLLLLRPRPSAWPVTSSNKLRPAAFGVTAPSPGLRTSPFPPIRSGISAPHLRHGRLASVMAGTDRPSLSAIHHFCCFLTARRSILSAGPSFLSVFVGLAVVMAGTDRPSLPPIHHFRLYLTARRSFLSANPSFLLFFDGSAVNFVRWTIIFVRFCRLGRRHGRPRPPSCRRRYGRHRPAIYNVWSSFCVLFDGLARNALGLSALSKVTPPHGTMPESIKR